MDDYKWTDIHFPVSVFNGGMMALGAVEGDPELMAFNGSLMMLNGGLALSGRKDEIKSGISGTPEKVLGGVYDIALKDDMAGRINDSGKDPGSRKPGRGVC